MRLRFFLSVLLFHVIFQDGASDDLTSSSFTAFVQLSLVNFIHGGSYNPDFSQRAELLNQRQTTVNQLPPPAVGEKNIQQSRSYLSGPKLTSHMAQLQGQFKAAVFLSTTFLQFDVCTCENLHKTLIRDEFFLQRDVWAPAVFKDEDFKEEAKSSELQEVFQKHLQLL